MESVKDRQVGTLRVKHSWRFYHIHRERMLWPVTIDKWRKQIHRWSEIRHYLLWNCWYVDPTANSLCHFINYPKGYPVLSLNTWWFLILQGSSSLWDLITCCLSQKEGRLVQFTVMTYMPSQKVRWFHSQILLFSPVWLILGKRTGALSFCSFPFYKIGDIFLVKQLASANP